MPIIRSTEGYLGFGKQNAQGTAVTPTERIYLSGAESIEATQEFENYWEQTGERFPSFTLKKFHKHDGGFPAFLRPDIGGYLTAMFVGADNKSGTTVPYTHILTVADSVPWMSIERQVGDTDNGIIERIADCKFNNLTISAEAGVPVVMEMEFLGTQASIETTASTASYDTQKPFTFNHGTFTLDGGTTTEITAFSLSMSNNLSGDIFSSEITREDILELGFSVDVSFTLKFVDTDWYKKIYYGGTAGTAVQDELYSGDFDVDLTYGSGTDARGYKIELEKVYFTTGAVHLTSEAEPIYQDCEGYMVKPDSGTAITITVKNTDDSEYL